MNTPSPNHRGRILFRQGCLLLLLCASGCVGPLPIPTLNEAQGHRLKPADVQFVRAGQTTRENVIQVLGTNYSSLWHDKAIAYSWVAPGWSFNWKVLIFGYYVGEAVPVSENLAGTDPEMAGKWGAYFIGFDPSGKVAHANFVRLKSRVPLHQQLDAWASRQPPKK